MADKDGGNRLQNFKILQWRYSSEEAFFTLCVFYSTSACLFARSCVCFVPCRVFVLNDCSR